MSPASPLSDPPSPPALAAFLRGVERRAAVLAELQTGDASAGDAAVAAAMRQWHAAADTAMGDWPGRFWSSLLAQPQLRARTPVALPLDATDRLGELGAGPRAALLLRLVAGLDEAAAAVALGVGEPGYRLALRGALAQAADAGPELQSFQRLREQVQRRIRTLPPDRLLRLSSAREAVLRGEADCAAGPGPEATARSRGRTRLLITLGVLLALCVLALAATYLPAAQGWLGHRGLDPAGAVLRETPAASRYGAQAGLIAHRDFALLADPAAAQAHDLAFHSWFALQPADAAGSVESESRTAEADTGAASDMVPPAHPGRSESADVPS